MRFLLSTTNRRTAISLGLSFLAVLLLACAPAWAAGDPPEGSEPKDPKKLSRSARRWVNRTLKKMTLEERVGQLLMVPYFGEFSNTHSEEFQRFLHQIDKLHIGGTVVATKPRQPSGIDKTDVYGLARLTNRLQKAARVPLLVSADFERGAAFRVRGTTDFPYNMAVGAAGDARYAYKMGAVAAREARAMGVHWVLAPVADVNNNPENPVINIRSFGEDPEAVAELVAAFVKGVEENGALATAKHFPGHGDTAVNSHLDLPTIAGDRARLDAVELVPFRAAIKAGVSSVMPGHLLVPAIEPDEKLAATFSEALLTQLLRREMGFDGLIITDAMVMSAIAKDFWAGEATVRAVEAGVDVVLMPPDPQVSFDALLRAVRSGRLSEKRLDESVRRILTAKARLGLHEESQVPLSRAEEVVGSVGSHNVAQKIADAGITLLRDNAGLLPIDSTRPQRGLLVVLSATPSPFPGKTLAAELKPRVDSLQVVRTDPLYFPPEEVELPVPESYDWVLTAVYQQGSDDSNEIGLPEGMPELVEQALAGEKPSALLVLGNPYLARHFPQAQTVLLSYSSTASSDRAVIRALFGQTRIQGHLPVTLPGTTTTTATIERGAGITRRESPMQLTGPTEADAERFAPVFELLDRAPAEGVAPGGVLAVGHRGKLVALRPFGRFTYDKKSAEVTASTLYDLASLTKVVGTTTAAMLLYEHKVLPLDAPVVRFLPEFGRGPDPEARRAITVQNLLTHSSGLPPYVRYFLELDNREEMLERIYTIPLEYPAGAKSVYSDLGVILLGEIIERVSGQPLEEFFRQKIFSPLGMEKTRYNPPKGWRKHIPPTEKDAEGRKGVIQGEVHDGNTWAMGGVAPHAGLFAPAKELAIFCQFLLNGGIYAHQRILKRETIEFFTRRRNIPDSTRALGWDTPSPPPEYSSAGKYISARAFGHTGYTGTSIWIDPERELFVVLLTNRVHPTRDNKKIREFRPLVHDAVIEALGLAGPPAVPQE